MDPVQNLLTGTPEANVGESMESYCCDLSKTQTKAADDIVAILAVDFDGIFHPVGLPEDEYWVRHKRFEEAMREVPTVSIISSSWRSDHTLEQLHAIFSPDIAERIIGVTPCLITQSLQCIRGLRQREIERWMADNAPSTPWLALDDRKELFEEDCTKLLYVRHANEGGIGLQREHLEEMVSRLKNCIVPASSSVGGRQLAPMSGGRGQLIAPLTFVGGCMEVVAAIDLAQDHLLAA